MVISIVSFDLAKYPDIEDAAWKAYWFLRKHSDHAYDLEELYRQLSGLASKNALLDALTYLTDIEVLDERSVDGMAYYAHLRDLPHAKAVEG